MNELINFLTDIKAAWIVAGAGATTGTASLLDFIPDDIGKLGTMISMALGVVLIASHVIKGIREHRIGKIELQLKTRQLDDLNRGEKKG